MVSEGLRTEKSIPSDLAKRAVESVGGDGKMNQGLYEAYAAGQARAAALDAESASGERLSGLNEVFEEIAITLAREYGPLRFAQIDETERYIMMRRTISFSKIPVVVNARDAARDLKFQHVLPVASRLLASEADPASLKDLEGRVRTMPAQQVLDLLIRHGLLASKEVSGAQMAAEDALRDLHHHQFSEGPDLAAKGVRLTAALTTLSRLVAQVKGLNKIGYDHSRQNDLDVIHIERNPDFMPLADLLALRFREGKSVGGEDAAIVGYANAAFEALQHLVNGLELTRVRMQK